MQHRLRRFIAWFGNCGEFRRCLAISARTVDVYRARLMCKVGAATTPELVNKLLAG